VPARRLAIEFDGGTGASSRYSRHDTEDGAVEDADGTDEWLQWGGPFESVSPPGRQAREQPGRDRHEPVDKSDGDS
jgi:hypothetical protein